MKLIERYILKQLIINSMLILLLILSIFSLSKSVQLIELSINRGLPFNIFFKLVFFSLPSIIPYLFPIIFCLSIFFTFSRMRNDRELIVIESLSGTKFSMLKPVIFYGTVLTLISLFFTINLSPKSNHNFRYLINDIKSKYSSSLLQEGVFNIIGEDFTIFVKQRHSDGKLKNIFIHDTREKGKPNTLISKQGTLIDSNNENKIFLEDGSQQFLSKEKSKLSILYFDKYLLSFSESSGSSLKRIWKTPSERSLSELSNPDLSNGDDFKNQQAFKAELIQRFSLPANTLCFGFLIISIMLSQRFMRDESLHFNIKILITILVLKSIFIICSSISVKFENFELINLVPFIISLLLGLYFQIKLYKNV